MGGDASSPPAGPRSFEHDIAVVGAGRIGLPWAAVLADVGYTVTCVDVDADRVATVEEARAPFNEPNLDAYMQRGRETERLRASNDPSVVADHRFVALTINAPRRELDRFRRIAGDYLKRMTDGQTLIIRSTLPVGLVGEVRDMVFEISTEIDFAVFPERLAEGCAIAEIETLPKVVGTNDDSVEDAMRALLAPLECEFLSTDPQTAMFVKLIDNSYRDALFAIANQIGFVADQLELDGHEAIRLANRNYPRNDIPTPGTVGGKCLPKDPHFLMDESICDQPTTPDLFNFSRRTNERLISYIVTQILLKRPQQVALLGLAYKAGVADAFDSPAVRIRDEIVAQGVQVDEYDPYVTPECNLKDTVEGADVVLVAVPHEPFEELPSVLNRLVPDAAVYDIWGILDRECLDGEYDGLGIN